MKRYSKLGKLAFWVASCAIAWTLGRMIVWWILENFITYDIPAYDSKRALVGVTIFSILSLLFSAMRDRYALNQSPIQIQLAYPEQINSAHLHRLLDIFVQGVQIALSGYISIYWFYQAAFWLSTSSSLADFNLFRTFSPFPTLLVLGGFVFLNAVISAYIIVLEPWRPITLNLFYRKYAFEKVARSKEFVLVTLSLERIFIYSIIQVIYYWFSIPNLSTRVPATILFVIMFCFWILYSRKLDLIQK